MTTIRLSVILGGLLLAMSCPAALGQSSAEAFFHEAAQQYVAGDAEAARRSVQRGLEVAPSDARLQALLKMLERQNDRAGGQSSQSGQQEQSSGEQPNDRPTEGDQSGAPEGESTSRSEQGRTSDPSTPQRSSSPRTERRSENRRRQSGSEEANRRRSALSQAQVARLLRALENRERKLLREIRVRSAEQTAVEKDW